MDKDVALEGADITGYRTDSWIWTNYVTRQMVVALVLLT